MTRPLTRRTLLERAALGGAALTLPGFLAACGGSDGETAATTATGGGELADRLRFANWQLYVDVDEATKKRPTLEQFKAETGVTVQYFEEINSNDEYFGKIQGPLSRGQGIDRDIIVLTDNSRYPGLMVEEGWLEELDKDAIPNIANLQDALKSPPFDPDRTYSLPWQSGMTGIAYNEKLTSTPITSIDQLLEDAKLKGKVTLLSEMADTLGIVMKANGDDPASVTDDTFKRAIDRVKAAVDSGQIRQFTGNDYSGPLSSGDLIAALSWSGDIVQLQADNASLKWGIPEDGGMIWTDNMLIPKGGDVLTASTYMNFVYDPKVAAEIAAYVNYVTPVKGAKEELAKTDPDTASNPLIFPDEETLAQVSGFDSKALNNQEYIEQWQTLLGA
jgi:spermidine/putrescine transport system substrate-binding protein